jgi:hypothetical protein
MASRITTQRTANAAESRGPITQALRTAPSIDADIRAPACGTVTPFANAIARRTAAERRKRSCKGRQRTLEIGRRHEGMSRAVRQSRGAYLCKCRRRLIASGFRISRAGVRRRLRPLVLGGGVSAELDDVKRGRASKQVSDSFAFKNAEVRAVATLASPKPRHKLARASGHRTVVYAGTLCDRGPGGVG